MLTSSLLFWLAAITLLFWSYFILQGWLSERQLVQLEEVTPWDDVLPSLSIIVAARNEQRHLEPAIRSLLQLDYRPLQVLAVNDRSTDRTGQILDQLAAEDARLQVVHITELPSGWLGKNYALHSGAAAASGQYLLFTDADVSFQPLALRRAIAYAQSHRLDHLALAPQISMPTALLEALVATFTMFFMNFFRPWKARDPHSRAFVGIGAFNLIRAEVYRAVGGHTSIRMRPDDDMKLGKVIKQNGYRQDLVLGMYQVRVPWYASLSEVIHGLEKNAFAGIDYNLPLALFAAVTSLVLMVWPYLALFLTTGVTRWLYLLSAGLATAAHARTCQKHDFPFHRAVWFPLTVLLLVYIQLRATWLTYWNRGIRWRGTLYPLDQLKANKV